MGMKRFDKKAVKDLRLECGLSQATFATAIGVNQMSVSVWESGKSVPSADVIARMSEVFKKPESFFFTSTD